MPDQGRIATKEMPFNQIRYYNESHLPFQVDVKDPFKEKRGIMVEIQFSLDI